MIFTFHSQATGNLMMFRNDAENLLSLLGKDITNPKGIITIEEMPHAISILQAAIRQDRQTAANATKKQLDSTEDEYEDNTTTSDSSVAFCQRAQPLLEMLKICQREEKPITWGV